jgi:hypothetical protein
VEKELDPAVGAPVPLEAAVQSAEGCDVLFSTTPWPYSRTPYEIIPPAWHVDLQLFPAENDTSNRPRDCKAKMIERGVRARLRFMAGIHGCTPERLPYPRRGLHSMFAADDVGGGVNANFARWASGVLERLPEPAFPYRGPFHRRKPGKPPTRHPGVVTVKRALHRAGYGNFDKPDRAWNERAAEALELFQLDVGLPPSGNYGKASWMELRRLPSAVPGERYAVQA